VDSDERKEKEWERSQEREENKKSRRINVLIALIALIGAIAGTVGATLGAKWGAGTTLEAQQRQFTAEQQQRTRELCLQLSTELDNATVAVFPAKPKSAEKVNRDRAYEQVARWDALAHRASVVAPLDIYDAAQNVSSVLRDTNPSPQDMETYIRKSEKYRRLLLEQLRRQFGMASGPLQHLPEPPQLRIGPNRARFEAAANQLRNTCRTELGQEPLPTPTQTR
jgi:hypothetical protein